MHPSPQKATWTSARSEAPASPLTLRERLSELAADRAAGASELVLETCAVLRAWVHERPLGWTWSEAARDLGEGLEAWSAEQGWRGAAARLSAALEAARELAPHGPREVLSEELGLWLAGDEAHGRWSGRPLDPGRRLPDRAHRERAARHAVLRGGSADGLERGETLLALGATETVALALEHAHDEGRDPRVLTGQGGPCVDGLRLARRLCEAGVAVTVTWDAALPARVEDVDRIWLGTEASDGRRFLAPVGTEALLRRARELGVAAELLLEEDQRLPAGAPLRTPAWGERDEWLLWDGAPEGVELCSQAFAAVPLELVHVVAADTAHPRHPDLDRTPIQA
jgi:hypothetical protein